MSDSERAFHAFKGKEYASLADEGLFQLAFPDPP